MFEWLEEQGKNLARASMGGIVEASVRKDYFLIKASTQISINISNGLRGMNLKSVENIVNKGLTGQAGKAAIEKVHELQNKAYYNEGADSITW